MIDPARSTGRADGDGAARGAVPWLRALAAIAGAAALGGGGAAGCGDDVPPRPPPQTQTLALEIGGAATDGSGFVALAGDVLLVPGAQGGFHVWMKYRVTGAHAGPMYIGYTVRRTSDDALILTTGGSRRRQDLGEPSNAGYWELPQPIPAFMCPAPIGIPVRDQTMRFRLELFSPEAQTGDAPPAASIETEFTPHCPEDAQATFCARICAG